MIKIPILEKNAAAGTLVSEGSATGGAGQISFAQVIAPVRDAMADFDREIRAKMTGQVWLLEILCRYLLWQKGKRLRPMLVLLSAGAAGAITPHAVKAAASIELLHTATLVHDDVVDNADTRRGFPSINGLWRNKVSVLIGDFILAQSLAAALEIRDFTVLDILTAATRRMSEGEILQVQKRRDLHITEGDYRQMITGKTGALFSAACHLGGVLGGDSEADSEALRSYGEHLGIAFQIIDDLFDYTGRRSFIGKPKGVNTKNNPISLPLIHALQQAPLTARRRMERLLRKGGRRSDQGAIREFCVTYGGLEYAEQQATASVRKAESCLSQLQPSVYVDALRDFLLYSVRRTR